MSKVFPTLSTLPDQEHFREGRTHNTMKSKAEAGYVFSRPRTTRRPRRTFATGYTNITSADKAALQALWDEVFGQAESFTWPHPTTGEGIVVRFMMDSLDFTYAGFRDGEHRWDIAGIELEEV